MQWDSSPADRFPIYPYSQTLLVLLRSGVIGRNWPCFICNLKFGLSNEIELQGSITVHITLFPDPLFKRVNVPKINDVFKQNALKFDYKYINNELLPYLCRFQLTRQGSSHPYDTGQGDQFRTTRTRINFVDHCLRNHLPSLLNSTPANIMSIITNHSLHGSSIYF